MKKTTLFLLVIVLACALTACGCKHEWAEATCTTAKTCTLCEEVEGEPLGHNWADATCEAPKTCSGCGLTEGEALGHNWAEATCEAPKSCSQCTLTEGEALGHQWNDADCQEEKICTTCSFASGEPGPHMDVVNMSGMGNEAIIWCKCGQEETLSAQDLTLRLLRGKWTLQVVQVDGKFYAPEPQNNWEEGTWLVFPSAAEAYCYQAGISDLGPEFIIPHDLSDFLAGYMTTNTGDPYCVVQCTALAQSSDGSSQPAMLRLVLGSRDYNAEDYTTKEFLEAAMDSEVMFLWRFTDSIDYIYGYSTE